QAATTSTPSPSSCSGVSATPGSCCRARPRPDPGPRRRARARLGRLHDQCGRDEFADDPGLHSRLRDQAVPMRRQMQMKRQIAIAAALALAVPSVRAAPPGAPNPLIRKMTAEVSAERIEARIRKLVSFGTRNSLSGTDSATRGIGAARRWIKAELEKCSA